MLYAVLGEGAPNSLDRRLAARPAHVARFAALQEEGRLVLAGPLPAATAPIPGPAATFRGSLIVAEFESLAAAQAWARVRPLPRRRRVCARPRQAVQENAARVREIEPIAFEPCPMRADARRGTRMFSPDRRGLVESYAIPAAA